MIRHKRTWVLGGGLLIAAIAVSAATALAAGPAAPVGDASALAACDASAKNSDYGAISGVIRGETATLAQVAQWQEQRNISVIGDTSSPLRAQGNPSETIVVCVFRGEFVTPTGPPALDGTVRPPHDVLTLLLMPDGSTVFDSAGYEKGSGVDTPSLWQTRSKSTSSG